MHTYKLTTKCHWCVYLYALWLNLNDSQDPKHTLFCRKNAFVAFYAFFRKQMSPFYSFGGGVAERGQCHLFYRFLYRGSPKHGKVSNLTIII